MEKCKLLVSFAAAAEVVSANLKVNEMFLIKDDRLPSSKWALGRIIEVHPGTYGWVRVVSVRKATGLFKRNVTKISLLSIDDPQYDDGTEKEENPIQST